MPDRLVIADTSFTSTSSAAPTCYKVSIPRSSYHLPSRLSSKPELVRAPAPDISSRTWIEVSSVRSRELLPAVTDLGPGEAEVIAFGLVNRKCLLILDDLPARRIAALDALPFTSTLGVLLKAKQERHVEARLYVRWASN